VSGRFYLQQILLIFEYLPTFAVLGAVVLFKSLQCSVDARPSRSSLPFPSFPWLLRTSRMERGTTPSVILLSCRPSTSTTSSWCGGRPRRTTLETCSTMPRDRTETAAAGEARLSCYHSSEEKLPSILMVYPSNLPCLLTARASVRPSTTCCPGARRDKQSSISVNATT